MLEPDENIVVKMYLDEGRSAKSIAETLGVYPNKIRRMLERLGIPIKGKSEAQKEALLSGRSVHPTEGKPREESVKLKISEKTAEYWKKVGPMEREARCHNLENYWQGLSDEEKKEIQHMSAMSRKDSAKNGSKFEHFLSEYLTKNGVAVILHKKGAIINANLELDLVLPNQKIVIEVDGPTHYLPIYGEEKLAKQQKSDGEKNGLLLQEGFVVIRFKHIVNNLTMKYQNDAAKQLLSLVLDIEKNPPAVGKRLIYI